VQEFARAVEGGPIADAWIGFVLRDGVGRADDVGGLPTGQGEIVGGKISGIFEIQAARFGAALPDAHEPDGVEAHLREGIPFGGGHVCERDGAAEAGRELFEPGPGVDFVEMGMRAHARGRIGGRFLRWGHPNERRLAAHRCQ
jgi:hypothetical protein